MSRHVVISGGATGIGRALAQRFAQGGDDVAIIGRRVARLQATVEAINHAVARPAVSGCPADLSSAPSVDQAASTLMRGGFDTVDVIINAAGGVRPGKAESLMAIAEDWEETFRQNVLTAVLFTEALRPRLLQPGGRVLFISSVAAVNGGGDAYSAAKAALIGWTYSLAGDLGAEGVTVNAIAPGYIRGTEFFGDRMTPAREQRLIERALIRRAGEPKDVAELAWYLASSEAGFITGQVLHVNGGAAFGR